MRQRVGRYLLLTPLGVTSILTVVIALGLITVLSFQRTDPAALFTDFTWAAYQDNVARPLFWRVLGRSLVISALVTIVTIVLAYPVAYFISFKAGQAKHILLVIVSAPFFTSYLLRIFGWKIILGFNGVLNSALLGLGLIDQPLAFLVYNPGAVIIALSHAYLAFAILPIYVSLDRIERALLEAASDLGARPASVFLKIVLPLSAPGVISAAVLIFVPTVGDYITPTLVGGPEGVMVANLIQSAFGKANDWPAGSAMSVATILTVGIPLLILFSLGHRRARSNA
ncbi:ABC transporter permease [Dongia soli]|uniref:ABC transporter permease n=1 Tax=Dongia soli TaxID=600628 RepID=A0ABU5EI76_9PROT|nr:ABC transporter permease [Dongia soli]MDY0885562.1 ABC transporter permease [Dongia soli]